MITPGQTLENPVTGERFTFFDTAATTGGELLSFELGLRAGGAVPIPHVHPVQTERFEVVEGRMRFRLGLRTIVTEPGDVVEVAPGVMHGFANAGGAEVIAMAEAGRLTGRGMPRNLLDLAVLARSYDREAHAPFLTVGLQRLLLAPLVFLARRRRARLTAAPNHSATSIA
jgi:mannose-6-phosphate isomerase-like protein (cupin superfamily)